ncbi:MULTISPECIES: hypothetical protein [Thermus]|uniref:Uncharacterized protein n=1 Tax=Thermus brockianus TaxID=56956 RepID=A0A1J0LY76_THEBO|nr:hypothetical protein [Thermus brockianus]APD10415.1 hypothetical protein A0O31_02390 [Thermus brockianus]
MDFSRDVLWGRMDGAMGKKAVETPVFLANPRQMDYLYPRERLRFLHPEVARRWAQERRRRRDGDEGEPLQGLDTAPWDWYRETVAVGLYVDQMDGAKKRELLRLAEGDPEVEALQHHDGPAILLCPERILSWAGREGVHPNLVLDKVYYHELGHALMDTGPTPYGELWCRIIEESLANWIAYSRFRGREARWVQRLIQGQPPEYWGYLAVEEGIVDPGDREWWEWLEERALRWQYLWRRPDRDWDEWWYFWRRLWNELGEWGYAFPARGRPPFLLVPGLLPLKPGVRVVEIKSAFVEYNLLRWKKAKQLGEFHDSNMVRIYAGFAEELLLRAVE